MSDLISRQAAIDAMLAEVDDKERPNVELRWWNMGLTRASEILKQLPSAQPDIIQCRNCKFASGDSRICMKFGHSPIGELDFCAWAERKEE